MCGPLGQSPLSPRSSGKASISPGGSGWRSLRWDSSHPARLARAQPGPSGGGGAPAGRGAAGSAHAVPLPHRRPCWPTPGRVQALFSRGQLARSLPGWAGERRPPAAAHPRARRCRVPGPPARRGWRAAAPTQPGAASRRGVLRLPSCSRASRCLQPALHPTVQMGKLRPRGVAATWPRSPCLRGPGAKRCPLHLVGAGNSAGGRGRGAPGAGTPARPAPPTHLQPACGPRAH